MRRWTERATNVPQSRPVQLTRGRITQEPATEVRQLAKTSKLAFAMMRWHVYPPVPRPGQRAKAATPRLRTSGSNSGVFLSRGMCCARRRNERCALTFMRKARRCDIQFGLKVGELGV